MPYKSYNNSGSGTGTYRGSTNEKVAQVDFSSVKKYPQALRNPFKLEQDVRIPDGEGMVPTCTFDVNQEFDIVSNANGFAALCVGLTAKPKIWTHTSTATATNLAFEGNWVNQADGNVQKVGSTTSDQSLLQGNTQDVADLAVIPTEDFWKRADTNYRGWRLVAAGVNVQFVGNDTNNQGIITGLHIAGGTSSYTTTNMDYNHTRQQDQVATTATALDGVWEPSETFVEQMADWNGAKFRSVTAGAAKGNAALDAVVTNRELRIVTGSSATKFGATWPGITSTHGSVYDLRNCLGSITRPVKDGLNLLYKPRTPSDFKYRRPLCGNSRPGAGNGLSLFWDMDKLGSDTVSTAVSTNWGPQNSSGTLYRYLQVDDTGNGCFLIAAHGMSTSPTVLKCRVVLHYEALPESNVNLTDGGKIAWADKEMVNRAAAAHLINPTPQP